MVIQARTISYTQGRRDHDESATDDPTRGHWCVSRENLNVWVDTNSLAIGVFLEEDKTMLEDVCWLCLMNKAVHINLVEFHVKTSQPSASMEG